MSLFEKGLILASLGGMGLMSAYYLFKPKSHKVIDKDEALKKRQELLKNPNVKLLYSSMSFFYLQGYDKKDPINSLMLMYDILNMAKPKYVSLQISDKEYKEEYLNILNHPKFPQAIKTLEYYLKSRAVNEIQQMKEFDLDNLENIYAMEFCRVNKCTIICADKSKWELEKLHQAQLKLQEIEKDAGNLPEDIKETIIKRDLDSEALIYGERRENFYVESLMSHLVPKFKIIPDSPYKVIVGVADPKNISGIANKWKQKFKSTYGHQILEEEVLPS